jgi:hypothetical protein
VNTSTLTTAPGILRFFVKPAAFIAANWGALLGVVSVVGLFPALAGAARVLTNLPEHAATCAAPGGGTGPCPC